MCRSLPFAIAMFVIAVQAIVLVEFGQPLVCECGHVALFAADVRSVENSQQFFDWYTFSHIIHGFIFYWFLGLLFPRLPLRYRLFAAVGIEAGWEILENTPMVIEHYRLQALAAGYSGDSVLNSVMDSISMIAGFLFARRAPVWLTLIAAVVLESISLYFIRDSLILNIVNFIHVFPGIAAWQAGI